MVQPVQPEMARTWKGLILKSQPDEMSQLEIAQPYMVKMKNPTWSVGLKAEFLDIESGSRNFPLFTIDFVLTKKSLSVNFIFPQIFSKTKIP